MNVLMHVWVYVCIYVRVCMYVCTEMYWIHIESAFLHISTVYNKSLHIYVLAWNNLMKCSVA